MVATGLKRTNKQKGEEERRKVVSRSRQGFGNLKTIGILSRKRYNFNAVKVRGMCYNIFCRIMTSLWMCRIYYTKDQKIYTVI